MPLTGEQIKALKDVRTKGLTKIKIKAFRKDKTEEFTALFNPEEYTINKDNNFAVQGIPGLSAPLIQFVNGNLRTLEMELFFDTWDSPTLPKRDVRDQTNQVIRLMEIDRDLHAPPILEVSWSSLQFRCVLARVSQRFILFLNDGRPVRARRAGRGRRRAARSRRRALAIRARGGRSRRAGAGPRRRRPHRPASSAPCSARAARAGDP